MFRLYCMLFIFTVSCTSTMDVKTRKTGRSTYEVVVKYDGQVLPGGNDTEKAFQRKAQKLCKEDFYTYLILFKRTATYEIYKGKVICR